jgi:Acetyltransferase (GNAT) domain
MSDMLAQTGLLKTSFISGGDVGVDVAFERLGSTKNPFALQAAMRVPLPSGKAASALECRNADNMVMGVWPMHEERMLQAIKVMRSPNVPLYETASTPMVRAGAELAVLKSFVQKLQQDPNLPSTIFAQSMLAEGPVWEAFQSLSSQNIIRIDIIEAWERSIMRRDAAVSATSYLTTQISAEQRKALRRKMAKLQIAGDLELVITDQASHVPQTFARFCQLEASGWKGQAGTALLHHPDNAAYFSALMTSMTAADRGFIAEVQCDAKTISAGLFVCCDDEIAFLRTAYDESLAKLSPGVILDSMLTTKLYERDNFALLDASTDGAVLPSSMFWPQRRKMAHVVIDCQNGSPGAKALAGVQHARLWLKQQKNKIL